MIKRHFLGWQEPILHLAADFFARLDEGSKSAGTPLDFSRTLVLVPGARAGRRFVEVLFQQFDHRALVLPTIVTPGVLLSYFDEQLFKLEAGTAFRGTNRAATKTEQLLAWQSSFKRLPTQTQDELIGAALRSGGEHDSRLARELPLKTATLFAKIKSELNAVGISIGEGVAKLSKDAPPDTVGKWEALAELWGGYRSFLADCNLFDLQEYRLEYLRTLKRRDIANTLAGSFTKVVLIGTVELNEVAKLALRLCKVPIHALVAAPAELADSFDELGLLLPEAVIANDQIQASWKGWLPNFATDRLIVAGSPSESAAAVIERLTLPQKESQAGVGQSLAFGLVDASVTPFLAMQLDRQGYSLHESTGKPVSSSPVISVLALIRKALSSNLYEDFAALVCHPLVEWLLVEEGQSVVRQDFARVSVDEFREQFTPLFLPSFQELEVLSKAGEVAASLRQVVLSTDKLLGSFSCAHNSGSTSSSFGYLMADFERVAAELFRAAVQSGFSSESEQELESVRSALISVSEEILNGNFTSALSSFPGNYSPAHFLELLLNGLSEFQLAPASTASEFDGVGWLELLHDDAPNLILCGLNDGLLPEPPHIDPFLGESVRRKLGLRTFCDRLNRDLYLLTAITNSRNVPIVTLAAWSERGEPILPSRLLLAGVEEELAKQVRQTTSVNVRLTKQESYFGMECSASSNVDWLSVDRLKEFVPTNLEHMAVTDFASYLNSPLQYLLERAIRISDDTSRGRKLLRFNDDKFELTPADYGELLHAVLGVGIAQIGEAELSLEQLKDALLATLDQIITKRYGALNASWVTPAVHLQLFQLREQLAHVAKAQFEWRAQGWLPKLLEFNLQDLDSKATQLDLSPDSGSVTLRGRIDRIDFNPETNAWMVLDYKSVDKKRDPVSTHLAYAKTSNPRWKDLQLPLYVEILRRGGYQGAISSGYFTVSSKIELTDVLEANWSQDQLDSAWAQARNIASEIRSGAVFGKIAQGKLRKELAVFAPLQRTASVGAANV